MVNARQTGQRIRSGLQVVANVTSAYAVKSLAVQSDQDDSLPWILAGKLCTWPKPARVVQYMDQSQDADGYYLFQWGFSYMTFGMYSFWRASFLPSGVWSAAVTVMTYDDTDTAVYLQCSINRPTTLTNEVGGYRDVIFTFSQGVIIT